MKKLFAFCFLFLSLVTINAQETENNNTTICWDVSFSMRDRDLEKEFEILEKVFERTPDQTVQLLLFNMSVEEKEFEITSGDWSALKDLLIQTRLDGATSYSTLVEHIKNKKVYVFTDGNRLFKNDALALIKGNFLINSVPNRDADFLKRTALIGRARLMDFAAIAPENIQKSQSKISQQATAVKGKVYIDNVPTNDVELRIKGSDKVFKTKLDGTFELPAIPGDSILITSRKSKTMKTLPIGYFSQNMDVFLKGNITTLDEVVVTEKIATSPSEDVVLTGYGEENKEKLGYATQSVGDEEISAIQTDVAQSVQGRFSNVNLKSDQDLTQFTTRPNNTLLGNQYGLVVIDGTPIETSDSSQGSSFGSNSSFIDPNNIEKITVLKGFAATNRYGTLGNGGVLLITTKTGNYNKGDGSKDSNSNSALVKNNVYEENVNLGIQMSAILNALQETKSTAAAYDKYLSLRNFNEENPSFYLDCFSYFKDKDSKIAKKIISNLWEIEPENENYLKTLEMAYRYSGDTETASLLNSEINERNPLALQPFFNEALNEIEREEFQSGYDKLSTLNDGGAYGTLNTSDISKSIDRELKNLVFKKRSQLDAAKLDEKYVKNDPMNVRMVVEWNNSATEFLLQFVNPQNRFFNWERTNSAMGGRIQDEIEKGFAMEEFEFYDDLKGEWKINAEFLGNLDRKNKETLVLMCTIYQNFGYPSQSKEIVWVDMNKMNQKQPITNLLIN